MIDLTRIFKKAAGVSEDRKDKIEAAVHTLKTELSCDMMISQEAADALDVMYEMAADHVSRKDVTKAINEITGQMRAFEAAGYTQAAAYMGAALKVFKNHVNMEEQDGLLKYN
jgi:iron-sulfur cluster repair protein YtfE (RIC family)